MAPSASPKGNPTRASLRRKAKRLRASLRRKAKRLKKRQSKQKQDELEPKVAQPQGPVDVERQCGVMQPHGQPCGRSLCCKKHSMNAKRAVTGRSLPFDMLLAAYRAKNQAMQQKAAIDANAPPLEGEGEANQAAGPAPSN